MEKVRYKISVAKAFCMIFMVQPTIVIEKLISIP